MARSNQQYLNGMLLLGCLYEVFSLTSRRVPTITTMLRMLAKHKLGRFIVWLWCGYVSWHFLEPLEELDIQS